MSAGIKQEAQTGFAPAAAYDAHRPSYSAEAVQSLLEGLEIAGVTGAKVADLAAGTGKFTEVLASRPEHYEITAIEPHNEMRAQLRSKNLRGVTVIDATAEDLSGTADSSLSAVVVAQAFHWFANMTALKEIHRVLQPTGVLGMCWNIEDYNAPQSWEVHPGWEHKMRDVIWSFDDDQPRFRHDKWRQVFEDQNRSNPFTLHFADPLFGLPLAESSIPFETWLSKDEIWSRYRTLSQVAILQGQELEKVKATFDEAINSKDTPTDGDGRVAVHGQTFLVWTSCIPDEPLRSGG